MSVILNDTTDLLKGVQIIKDAVSSTLGPRGRTVIIKNGNDKPFITKDGVTVSKNIKSDNAVSQMAIDLIKEAASMAVVKTGDGTTTTTLLACELILEGSKIINSLNPYEFKEGMLEGVKKCKQLIKEIAIKNIDKEMLINIATISANNNEEIGIFVGDVIHQLGENSIVDVVESRNTDTSVEITNGYSFDKGMINPYFSTDKDKNISILENALVLVYDKKISNGGEIIHLLNYCRDNDRPLLIIANDVEEAGLATLVNIALSKAIKLCAVRSPGYGDKQVDYLDDIAIYTGALLISEDTGVVLSKSTPNMLGSAEKVIVTSDKTVIINNTPSNKHALDIRVNQLKELLQPDQPEYKNDFINERIAKLTSGVAKIKVGGLSETEMRNKKDLIEDAVGACMSAKEQGIIIGGGYALYYISEHLEKTLLVESDTDKGCKLLINVIKQPCIKILSNAGYDVKKLPHLKQISTTTYISEYNVYSNVIGFNSLTRQSENFIESGIIDPAKVTITALETAVNIASEFLTVNCIINNKEHECKSCK